MRNQLWMGAGLVGGLVLGFAAWWTENPVLLWIAGRAAPPVGRLFMNLLSMVVIPLVTAALFTGVASLGNPRQLGRLGTRTLGFFWGSTVVAIAIGFLVAGALLPLAPLSPEQRASLRQDADTAAVPAAAARTTGGGGAARFLVELVPPNPVRAAVDGSLLPLIVFITIFGVAAATLPDEQRRTLTDLGSAATQALTRIMAWVLLLAPVGILALVAPVAARLGPDLLKPIGMFYVSVILGLAILIGVVYVPAVAFAARVGPVRFLRAALPSLAVGFSTTSSLAALPAMLDSAERDLGISRDLAGFVLPLGASVNRAGSALYQAVAVLFVAQLYDATFGFGAAFQAGAAVFLASLTVAAVPAGSVVSLAPAFAQAGLPLTGLSVLIGLDRIPDMFRTMTNVAGHMTGAVVMAAVEARSVPRRAAPA